MTAPHFTFWDEDLDKEESPAHEEAKPHQHLPAQLSGEGRDHEDGHHVHHARQGHVQEGIIAVKVYGGM